MTTSKRGASIHDGPQDPRPPEAQDTQVTFWTLI